REELRLGERLSLRLRRELLRRGEHALEIENERIALRERPALPGYRLERLRHVEHLVALDQPQAVPVEAADLHLSLLQRRAVDPPPERDETPARSLRVEAEADMARKGVRVAEDALERIGLVDAVRSGHCVQRIDGFGAEGH